MLLWEQTLARLLQFFRLEQIKQKILVFALLATLIPSLAMGWLSYVQNTEVVTEKVTKELQNATSHTARELALWMKQRIYELRVFSGSYEVSENLEQDVRGASKEKALQRLTAYLTSVSEKFADYEALVVINSRGRVVATSADKAGPPRLPANWMRQARAGDPIVGEPYWDENLAKAVVKIAVPIQAADGPLLGVLAVKLNFHNVESIMKDLAIGKSGQMYLVDSEGSIITSATGAQAKLMGTQLPGSVPLAIVDPGASPLEYENLQGARVLASAAFSSQREWGVVAEIDKTEVYAETTRIRNIIVSITFGVLIVIGMAAYVLGVSIVRPLYRLTKGAEQVANGNLGIEIPVVSGNEIGYLTRVFNDMVSRLRQSQEELDAVNNALMISNKELQELSITDSLTGLHNRRYIMDALSKEMARAQRLEHHFSVLMIDLDNFKHFNDSHGHSAGDDLLTVVGSVFRESIRNMDVAARYGGEEFLIMLPELGKDRAGEVAERIRSAVDSLTSEEVNASEPVTVSIGVASYPENGATTAQLIESADKALYEGKKGGRNRVVIAAVSTPVKQSEVGKRTNRRQRRS